MRTTPTLAVLVGTALSSAGVARADDVAGVYEVKYEEVSTNCTTTRLTYAPGNLTVKLRGKQLIVDIARTPEMVGTAAKNGKVSATSKRGGTMIEGMQGVFSVAGRITPEGTLFLTMIGEYSANGKPLCTQSWNVSGPRAAATAKPAKPAK
jgi:hypothetical protein